MERLFMCLESATRVLLLPPETMLFAKVTRRSLAILSASHVYTLRPQRLQLSCQHSPEPRSHRAAPGQWVNPELWISTLTQCPAQHQHGSAFPVNLNLEQTKAISSFSN